MSGPLSDGQPPAPQPAGPREQVILVVDDEVDIRESLKDLLEGSLKDVRVLVAEGGQAGLDFLKREPVDLIVTDYKMPGMNGLEFLAHARRVSARVPRILITAFPDLDLAIRAINEESIENFFTKPLEPAKVVDVIRTVLDERRAQELRDRSFARSLDVLRRQLGSKR